MHHEPLAVCIVDDRGANPLVDATHLDGDGRRVVPMDAIPVHTVAINFDGAVVNRSLEVVAVRGSRVPVTILVVGTKSGRGFGHNADIASITTGDAGRQSRGKDVARTIFLDGTGDVEVHRLGIPDTGGCCPPV